MWWVAFLALVATCYGTAVNKVQTVAFQRGTVFASGDLKGNSILATFNTSWAIYQKGDDLTWEQSANFSFDTNTPLIGAALDEGRFAVLSYYEVFIFEQGDDESWTLAATLNASAVEGKTEDQFMPLGLAWGNETLFIWAFVDSIDMIVSVKTTSSGWTAFEKVQVPEELSNDVIDIRDPFFITFQLLDFDGTFLSASSLTNISTTSVFTISESGHLVRNATLSVPIQRAGSEYFSTAANNGRIFVGEPGRNLTVFALDAEGRWEEVASLVSMNSNSDMNSESFGYFFSVDGDFLVVFRFDNIAEVFEQNVEGDWVFVTPIEMESAFSGFSAIRNHTLFVSEIKLTESPLSWIYEYEFDPYGIPTAKPTFAPTTSPTLSPTTSPTLSPIASPNITLTTSPNPQPTASPDPVPTASPDPVPTASPDPVPTASPDPVPTSSPPSESPPSESPIPTESPSTKPTFDETKSPSRSPIRSNTKSPTMAIAQSEGGVSAGAIAGGAVGFVVLAGAALAYIKWIKNRAAPSNTMVPSKPENKD